MVKDGVIEDYVIGGATALLYFSEPTFTEDIDVFVYLMRKGDSTIVDMTPLYEYLTTRKGYRHDGDYILVEGFPVQFIVPYDALSVEAFSKAVVVSLAGNRVKIFDIEYLIAIMVQLGKRKYRERLRIIVEDKPYDEAKLTDIVTRFGLIEKWNTLKSQLR
jgi:hypothetical protein